MPKQRIIISIDGKIVEWIDQQVREGKFRSRDLLIEKCLRGCKIRSAESPPYPPPSGSSAVKTAVSLETANAFLKQPSNKPPGPPSQSPPSSTVKVAVLNGIVASSSRPSPKKPQEPPTQKKKTKEVQKVYIYEYESQ